MTSAYFQKVFPFGGLQNLILKTSDQSPFSLRVNYFPGWQEDGESFKNEPTFSEALIEKLSFPRDPKLECAAIHWSSPTEKLFVLDLDYDPESDAEYAQCLKTHTAGENLCPKCWNRLLKISEKIEVKFKTLHESGKMYFCEREKIPRWRPFLRCFSGKRGMHLYVHPALNYQFLDAPARVFIVKNLSKIYPIDLFASSKTGDKTIRLWFSPHLKTRWCATPFLGTAFEISKDAVFWQPQSLILESAQRAQVSFDVLQTWFQM